MIFNFDFNVQIETNNPRELGLLKPGPATSEGSSVQTADQPCRIDSSRDI
jgi:hypothetical protein